jgi:hypothetical protein
VVVEMGMEAFPVATDRIRPEATDAELEGNMLGGGWPRGRSHHRPRGANNSCPSCVAAIGPPPRRRHPRI